MVDFLIFIIQCSLEIAADSYTDKMESDRKKLEEINKFRFFSAKITKL